METPVRLVACHECDVVQQLPTLAPGSQARCVCCDGLLAVQWRGGLEVPLALSLTAAVLFLIASMAPLLTIELRGAQAGTTLAGAAVAMYEAGQPLVAGIVLFATVLGPALVIGAQFYVLIALHTGVRVRGLRTLLVVIGHAAPWGMLDVFLLGVVVALMKLVSMSNIVAGSGLYAFAVLIPVIAWAESRLDLHLLWDRMEQLGWC